MRARTNATSTGAGILRPTEFARHASVERLLPAPGLDRWVENHWCLRWDLPPGTVFHSQTLPHPACTLSVELGRPRPGVGAERVLVTGVVTRRFEVPVADRGWVLGVKFRPGGLAALAGLEARALTDRLRPAAELLPAPVVDALRVLDGRQAPAAAAGVADRALLGLAERRGASPDPGYDPGYDTVLRLVTDLLRDRSLVRVAQLEERHAVSRRQVERLFARYVGASPKWVLARYRMHDVVTALDAGYAGSLADLAAEHGWYDQAHFTRDFTRLVGVPPHRYRQGRP
ncbi:AraC family transcriptional regulator [Nocardioides pantholopis]|uniref:AraC family transcriptional regulator n=1 Tax=Nocardioides pantholopis TaxID=2483798 RepID=UPI0019CFF0BB|nr:helix-turn-helix domain-containing protein [Nocardioides pantholopis]